MTAVLLLDGNRRNIARRILPYALDIGNSGFLQSEPDVGRAERNGLAGNTGRRAEDNRIVAMHHGFHLDYRLISRTRSVVTGPFTEWTFLLALHLGRKNESFDGQLGRDRDRESGFLAADNLDRFIAKPTRNLQLGNAPW